MSSVIQTVYLRLLRFHGRVIRVARDVNMLRPVHSRPGGRYLSARDPIGILYAALAAVAVLTGLQEVLLRSITMGIPTTMDFLPRSSDT